MPHAAISLHNLSFYLPLRKPLFENLTLNFKAKKIALVGKNGSGKSTLLKLIMGEVLPGAGTIKKYGQVHYVPQTPELSSENILSGGELTQHLLTQAFTSQADILLLDEPTNHLDQYARQQLIQQIQRWPGNLIIASHDRELLNSMDEIIELSSLGATRYGGNYAFYEAQKNLEHSAKERQLSDAKKYRAAVNFTIQASREKHTSRAAYGKKLRKTKKIDKMTADSKLGKSQRSQAKMLIKQERLIQQAKSKLKTAQDQWEILDHIDISIPDTHVPNGKVIVDIQNLNFSYDKTKTVFNNFNLLLQGPERIALQGKNGSGKSTLFKLILNQLKPDSGTLYIGTPYISYLDQQTNQLNPDKTLIQNFMDLNPDTTEETAHRALAQFLFRNTQAHKLAKTLSGGERLRALLACLLLSKHPPQLLLLDEPTNHLDLACIKNIESALNHYEGALIVVSHDPIFLGNLTLSKHLLLS